MEQLRKRIESENLCKGALLLGQAKLPGLGKFPVLYHWAEIGSLSLLYNSEQKVEFYNYLQFLAFKFLTDYDTNSSLLLIDSKDFGQNFRQITSVPTSIRASRVLTSMAEIGSKLDQLRERIAEVNSDVLGSQSAEYTMADFLLDHKNSNEKLYLVVIEGFPYGWKENDIQAVYDIMRNGPRAGVFVLTCIEEGDLHGIGDRSQVIVTNILSSFSNFIFSKQSCSLKAPLLLDFLSSALNRIEPLIPSRKELDRYLDAFKMTINSSASKAIYLDQYFKLPDSPKKSSTDGISIPIGIAGGGEVQYFEINDELNAYHALIGGMTGSGKTVLIHNLIVYGSALYHPSELQFCLLDFKEGTEFQFYKNFESVRVLSIESKQEFGLSFLRYLSNEINLRGKLFKEHGVSNYKALRMSKGMTIPRIVVVIDEFQVLLSDDYTGSSDVKELLDDIVKRGRSFGVHLILSSQSLSGINIRESTLNQMPTRVVLRVTAEDSERFLESGNKEPAMFEGRGQAIINYRSGLKNFNRYFNITLVTNEIISEISESIHPLDEIEHIRGLKRKVFDLTAENVYPVTRLTDGLRHIATPYYMSENDFISHNLSENLLFHCLDQSKIDRFVKGLLEQCNYNEKLFQIGGEQEFDNYISGDDSQELVKLLKELKNSNNSSLVLIPDIECLTCLKGDSFVESEAKPELIDFLKNSLNATCYVGIHARRVSRTYLNVDDIEMLFRYRALLSGGTEFHDDFGFYKTPHISNDETILKETLTGEIMTGRLIEWEQNG